MQLLTPADSGLPQVRTLTNIFIVGGILAPRTPTFFPLTSPLPPSNKESKNEVKDPAPIMINININHDLLVK